MAPISVAEELLRIRRKLIDLTTHNTLLNFRYPKQRSVRIVDELPNQIYERLVLRQGEFTLWEQTGAHESLYDGTEAYELPTVPENAGEIPAEHADSKLQTILDADALEARMKKIQTEATSSILETGTNILYLALGVLAWKDAQHSDRVHSAPLILIPLNLDRKFDGRSNRYRYRASYDGEEVQTNLSLAEKLEQDFGLCLPEFEEGDRPEDYFDAVTKAVASQPTWGVRREAVIGFFSFAKLLMYRDLDAERWFSEDLTKHQLLREIIEGRESDSQAGLYAADYKVDQLPGAHDLALVLDADSSQHSAIIDAADGKNFVIEGPPGTGKSQTITNLIAWAMSAGKTVLFVAEKLAALEVVHANLSHLGLKPFCLELHSRKARPAVVYADLGERMAMRFPHPRRHAHQREHLEDERSKLNDYLAACKQPVGPRGRPIHETIGRVVELRAAGANPQRTTALTTDLTEAALEERLRVFDELAAHVKEIGAPQQHPYAGFHSAKYYPRNRPEVAKIFAELQEKLGQLQQLIESFEAENELSMQLDMRTLRRLGELPGHTLATPEGGLCEPLCRALHLPTAESLANELLTTLQEYKDAAAVARELPVRDEQLAQSADATLGTALATEQAWSLNQNSISDLRLMLADLATALQLLSEFSESAAQLEQIGLGDIRTLADYETACNRYQLLSHTAIANRAVIRPQLFLTTIEQAYSQAWKRCAELQTTRSLLSEFALADVPPAEDLGRLRRELRPHAASFFRFLNGAYRRTRREIRSFLNRNAKFDPRTMVDALEQLEQFIKARHAFENDASCQHAFGPLFQGLDTDWQKLEELVRWGLTATRRGLDHATTLALIQQLDDQPSLPSPTVLAECAARLLAALKGPRLGPLIQRHLAVQSIKATQLDALRNVLTACRDQAAYVVELLKAFSVGEHVRLHALREQLLARLAERDLQRQIDDNAAYAQLLGDHFAGASTDADLVRRTLAWVNQLTTEDINLPAQLRTWLLEAESAVRAGRIQTLCDALRKHLAQIESTLGALSDHADFDSRWLEEGAEGCLPDDMLARITGLRDNLDQLDAWSDFCRAVDDGRELGLADFMLLITAGTLSPREARDSYELTLLELALDPVLSKNPVLRRFSRHKHEATRERFRELDSELLELERRAIAARASERPIPSGVSTGRVGELTEYGLLAHEVEKQRRHCRLRQLMARAGTAVQALKPCFMMSPLSVAQFLPPGQVKFDLVLMDEASQIRPEDALGAIARGKQLIVVGDPKQLPPTSFFDRFASDEIDPDDETIVDDAESILEVASKAYQPIRMLRWHYRSQHESLIAFSNHRFYANDLIVFPSPTKAAGKLGVYLHRVEDATFQSGGNLKEAQVVAAAIAQHALNGADRSLGVGTFNAQQRDLIEDCLDRLCRDHRDIRLAVEKLREQNHALFIKNLENLQGDERDVIYISYTYGPDPASGRVFSRFGPINRENGWRRLNVLITRARQRVDVFASFAPEQIVYGGEERHRGVSAMKDYLAFAGNGHLLERGLDTGGDFESPFERAVAGLVRQMGYEVVPQVGVAGYRIDLGVCDPHRPDEFLLGIECDGATYHSAKSARDRDRLREDVIRSRGWNLHRIWSTDWYRNQDREQRRLQTALERLTTEVSHPQ